MSEAWKIFIERVAPSVEVEMYFSGALPEVPQCQIADYSFQIVQIPLRSILQDLRFAALAQSDSEGHKKLFEDCKAAISFHVRNSLKWNREHGILTFVTSFLVPQQNFMGRLMSPYQLENPRYFVQMLNEHLAFEVSRLQNVYFFDVNEIGESLGKRFTYEDHYSAFNHGAHLSDFDYHQNKSRLEPVVRIEEIYDYNIADFYEGAWREVCAMYRTIRQIDSVKMVVVDLDDTFWRGVIAEAEDLADFAKQEGWPRGFWETLLILKRRGIILAIISKNEESVVRDAWKHVVKPNLISLDDFSVVKINWDQKSKNMAEILKATNLLSKNVVYIDDNPIQREDIKQAFPEIRVLGGMPGSWRHVLLWAPETQVADVTSESAARTEMVQAQVRREEERKNFAPDDFVASLNVKEEFFPIQSVGHPKFKRVMELINKTNQFNTTGARWTQEQFIAATAKGVRFYAFEVSDRFTEYGLVGVVIVEGNTISQFVMSCRVMGLDVEATAVGVMANLLRDQGYKQVRGVIVETNKNLPCRSLYERAGFAQQDGAWIVELEMPIVLPTHMTVTKTDFA